MKKKNSIVDIGLVTTGAVTEVAWTGFLVWATSKIPYVGIPIATLLGITGSLCTLYIINCGRFYNKN